MNKVMTHLLVAVAGIAFLPPCTGKSANGPSYLLETGIYIFKSSELQSVKLPAAKKDGAVVIRSPATIKFAQATLSLNGSDISWSDGRNPPPGFTLIRIPEITTARGKPVEILSTAPIQYLEKAADGTLQVRTIGKDSSNAPHCRIRFTIGSRDEANGDLRVSCDLDLATVSGRAKVPGVSLDVGRPILTRFADRAELAVRPGEWTALLLRAPNGNVYSLLLLLKTTSAQAAAVRDEPSVRPMTAQEFTVFLTYYYRHPQPELISRAIESLAPSNFLDRGNTSSDLFGQHRYTCVGFFAEVFAANPNRVAGWKKIIERPGQDGTTRYWLRRALHLRRPKAILAFGPDRPSDISDIDEDFVFWGAFFASGDPAYLRKLVDRLDYLDEADYSLFDAGGEAMVLFAYNGPHHPLVRHTLEAVRKEVKPRTRQLIDDLLHKDLAAVLQEVASMDKNLSSGPGYYRTHLPWRRDIAYPDLHDSNRK